MKEEGQGSVTSRAARGKQANLRARQTWDAPDLKVICCKQSLSLLQEWKFKRLLLAAGPHYADSAVDRSSGRHSYASSNLYCWLMFYEDSWLTPTYENVSCEAREEPIDD